MRKYIAKILIILILIQNITPIFNIGDVFAVSTTIIYPTVSSDIWGWNYSWTNPNNAIWDTTGTSADWVVPVRNNNTNFLSLTNFDFAWVWLPSNAIINGIQADVEWQVNGNRMRDLVVQLTKDWTTRIGSNYGNNIDWPLTKTTTTYGWLTDLWWTTWTANDVLSPNFWIHLQYRNTRNASRTVNVYRVWITIDYTIPAPVISPGWTSTWLQIWLKADKWTSTTIDWNALTTWNDQSWNWFNAWWWVSPIYLNNTTSNLNFNPVVNFNWSQYLENLNNWAYSHSYFAVVIPDNQVDWSLSWQVPFWFDCNSWILNTGTCGLTFAWLTLWAFTAAINDEVITNAIWASTSRRSSQIWAYSYEASKPMLIWMNENALSTNTDIYEKWLKIDNYTANTYQNLSTADYRIWMSMDWANPFPYSWKIAEVINYSSRINDIDRQKIESYLAIKYWITLNSWIQDYIASDWTTKFFDTTLAWVYNNDIFGIARDDLSELSQIKSKSTNNDNIITIEAVWEWTNLSPAFVDIDDFESLTIANNDLWNTWSSLDAPVGFYNLSRKWRVQEQWEIWSVNLDFDVWNPIFNVPDLSIGTDYYFIYDSNNNDSLADEIPQIMTNTSWNIWQIAWIDLNHLNEFTISTIASTNNIPTDITISNDTINENVVIWTNIWTLSTTDSDLLDSHTYSFVAGSWDDDNWLFTIAWDTLSINESPDFEIQSSYSTRIQTDDWNWWQFQKIINIFINNIWEIISSLLDFELPWKYIVTSWAWNRTTTNPYEWLYSIESDNWWVANTQSCFQVNHTFSSIWTIDFFYSVSSETNDFLRFYIDNIEQSAWSWNVPWAEYTKTDILSWTHTYKWCYIKDWATSAWTDNAFIDYITFQNTNLDILPPDISSINHASGSLLPWWNHTISIDYSDLDSWVNISSDIISLYKWNWTWWWADISATWINLWTKIVTATNATYTTNNLSYWKYLYDFSISDNNANISSTWAVFYIDSPEIIVSSWSIDMWNLNFWTESFSPEIEITVKTVWAWFDLLMNKTQLMTNHNLDEIIDYDWSEWVWYDKEIYSGWITYISTDELIWNQIWSININWEKNIYIFKLKTATLISPEQAAWIYDTKLKFWIKLDY